VTTTTPLSFHRFGTRRAKIVATATLATIAVVIGVLVMSAATGEPSAKRVCVYSGLRTSVLSEFSTMVHRDIDCAVVYNNKTPDWAGWQDPWFLHYKDPDYTWARWATAKGKHRQLIISQSLIPLGLKGTDWVHAGARGDYRGYARTLARNLIAAGLGDAIIRLAPEANGTWTVDSLGATDEQMSAWAKFWRQTVAAMKSVPNAHFKFDWTVNAGVQPIPFEKYYPGDDAVDIIGIDAFDRGPTGTSSHWDHEYDQPGGVRDLLHFAKSRGKPISFPEWGLAPQSANGAGDDPTFVNGIANVVNNNNVAYQAYFYSGRWGFQLAHSPRSLEAYRAHFGSGGDAAP
jgi:hypothetical protein